MKPGYDNNDRPYATVYDTDEGDILTCDDGFLCLPSNEPLTLHKDQQGLFVFCNEGKHHLEGQLDQTQIFYIGFYHVNN